MRQTARATIAIEHVTDIRSIAGAVTPKATLLDLGLEDCAATVQRERASGDPAYQFRAEG